MSAPCIITATGEIVHRVAQPLLVAEHVGSARSDESTIAHTQLIVVEAPVEAQFQAAGTLEQFVSLAEVLAKLVSLLPGLAGAIDRQTKEQPLVARITLRLDEVAEAVGVSRRVLERERAAGRMPKPDIRIGKMPLWRPETIQAWVNSGRKGVA
jgi:predicted DNA-binding transcriptional regulator AlpA